MSLKLHRLQIFSTVYEMSNVSKAARQLRLSQPTVSRHLAIFEHELKIKLFNNVSGRLEPTWEAHRLYEESKGVFTQMERVEHRIAALQAGTQDKLRIMVSPDLGIWLLPQAVEKLQREMPALDIIVDSGGMRAQLAALRRGDADIAVGGPAPASPDLKQGTIGAISLVALVHEDDPMTRDSSFDLSALAHRESVLLDHTGPLGHKVLGELSRQGISLYKTHFSRSTIFSISLAQKIRATTVTYMEAATHLRGNDMRIMPLAEPIDSPLVVIELATRPERRATSAFKEALRRAWQGTHLHQSIRQ